MTRKKLSLEEHDAMGKKLFEFRQSFINDAVELAHVYGKSKRTRKLAVKVMEAVDALRCELDEQIFRDYPEYVGRKPTPNGQPLINYYYRVGNDQ